MDRSAQPGGRSPGFSLIELLVTVALLGLLASLALPSYVEQLRRGRRADAYDAMAQVQQRQARHRSLHPRYAASLDELRLSARSGAGHYLLTLSEATAEGYLLSVRPAEAGKQAGDHPCASLQLRVVGELQRRSSSNGDGADSSLQCWPQ